MVLSMSKLVDKLSFNVKTRILELILGFVSIGSGIWLISYVATTKWAKAGKSPINNPIFFPRIIGYMLIVVGILLLIQYLTKKSDVIITLNLRGFPVIALWAVYVLVMQYIGFILASIIAIALTMLYWGCKNYKAIILSSIIAPCFIYLVLGVLLGVRFPTLFL